MRNHRFVALAALLLLVDVMASRCSKASPPPPPPAAATASAAPVLFGAMTPVVSVKELMYSMIDPVADNIFDAVWWDLTPKGTIAHAPKTDEDWDKVKTGAVSLAEGVYLLKVPRPFTPAGDVNHSTGPNPPELSPTEIKAKLDKDPVLWEAKIEGLRNVALEVLEIVKKKDTAALFEASEDLDVACENCHLEYWYPGDRKAVDEDKRQRARIEKGEIRESRGKRSRR